MSGQQHQPNIPGPGGGGQEQQEFTVEMPIPPKSDILDKLDKALEAELPKAQKRKPAKPQCCGILPCKGRNVHCYTCDICLDCISAAGCGHDDSRHNYKAINEME